MAKKSLKDALYQYFAQAHFNAMSAEQFARFKDYIKAKDFQGNMRWWEKSFMENGEKKPVPDFTDYKLEPEDWTRLYDWFQATLESMYTNLDDEYAHTLFVPGFVKKWFGPGRIFQSTVASDGTEEALDALATFLKKEDGRKLGDTLKRSPQLRDVFSGELTFDAFVAKLEAKEYNKDLKFRKKVNDVVAYISQYMPQPGENAPYKSNWPQGLGYESDRNEYTGYQTVTELKGPLKELHEYFDSNNASSWINTENEEDRFKFDETKKSGLVDIFKKNYQPLLNTLVTGEKKIREEFQKHDQGSGSLITEQLNKAFKDTDYDNKESKDYVVPKQTEERNFIDRIKKFKDDTYQNYFEQFFEPRYGAHVYHTTYARTVGEAFDKVGIKPSGGIDGIIAKKDDIIKEINKKAAGKALKHFNWFVTTMEEIKKSIPKAYNDALRNPHQMRAVVSQIIIKALKTKPYDDGEAKTAMELLALTRYGVMASRFREGLSDGLKDVKLFSDKDLSWNKNEGIKFVTGAIDTTLKFGVKALALGGTVGYNLVKNRFKRKFGKDISGNADLAAAYKAWKENDTKAFEAERDAATVNKGLYEKGYTKSGKTITDNSNSTSDYIGNFEKLVFYKKLEDLDFDVLGELANYEKLKNDLSKKSPEKFSQNEQDQWAAIEKCDKILSDKYIKKYLADNGKKLTPVDLKATFDVVTADNFVSSNKNDPVSASDLEDDVTKYRKLMVYADTSKEDEQKRQWRKDNADNYAKLIAFWDELDTFTKTHSFKFGNMKLRRDLWLKNFNRDKDAGVISPMEEEANEFAESYYDNITYDR